MTLYKLLVLGLLPVFFQSCSPKDDSVQLLLNAHAHNDYNHERPLLDALSYGFISVEADIHLLHDTLFVAHDSADIQPTRTLQNLYLDPLKKRISNAHDFVYGDSSTLILLVDIKTDSLQTYIKLHQILEKYKNLLTIYEGMQKLPGPVSVLISGNRPVQYIKNQKTRFAAIDGRFDIFSSKEDAFYFPLVSESWKDNFTWQGQGEMPEVEKTKLNKIIRSLHANGQILRFWATPDAESTQRENVWNQLCEAGVDLIGSDDLKGLAAYLNNHKNN